MIRYPNAIKKVVSGLKKIPGIGPKSAERIAFFLLASSDKYTHDLSESIGDLKKSIKKCNTCFSIIDENEKCEICDNQFRDHTTICVLETFRDMLIVENTGEFKGLYHVLEGHLSPLDGITPEQLRISELITRIKQDNIKELIIATSPNIEGDATAFYIAKQLKDFNIKVSRIAKGLPVGSDLEFADSLSLSNSLKNREEIK